MRAEFEARDTLPRKWLSAASHHRHRTGAIATHRPLHLDVRAGEWHYRGPATTIGVLESVHFAGGMRYDTPVTRTDGSFDINLWTGTRRIRVLTLIAGLYQGRFTGRPGTACHRASALDLRPDRAAPLELDGEIIIAESARLDVRDTAAVWNWVRQAHSRYGRIDAAVTFAALGFVGAVEETDPDEAAAILDTNVIGTHRVLRAVLPIMRAQRAGRVIVVSSGAGAVAEPYGGWYSATKGAVERLGEAVRREVAPFGVHVSILAPGWTVTPIDAYDTTRADVLARVTGYLEAGQSPEAVARRVQSILTARRPRQSYLCGSDVRTSFWTRRLVPARLYEHLVRRYCGL
ncbi:SDR family NAD(P)-dependent oxidoreductase [Nocardia caishijiensis]|uniref:Short-subunit dehydrogenase n=1 Tax=Nocardia caishijiensis TaxID=184756 RepID=A0ABQ6YMA6_9NOCA|nr:SDR family NAD(P)-dependent oxidoreductase [Nocardia caishijiensis]KAF0846907.1 short-subunit dehydrogenase [Nocardia caishijiensis]